MSTEIEVKNRNPLESAPKPPFPEQHQEAPGVESAMQPRPDHGEQTYIGHGRLKDRVALLTGADSGIGKAVAIAYAREGADVAFSYLNERQDAEDTVSWIEEAGRKSLAMPGDICDEQHCIEVVERTMREFGKLDILVNLAAFGKNRKCITDIPSDEWHKIIRTNLDATFYLCKAAVPHLKHGSCIINTASVEAFEPDPNALAYSTSKGAIVTFTKSVGQELIGKGIRVNVVCPGPTWTPIITTTVSAKKAATYGEQTPEKRAAQPREVAPMYVFLASDEASFIANEVFVVAGGMPLP